MISHSPLDTIAAISTPLGQAGIGIVRISGRQALKIADNIFRSRDHSLPSDYKTHTLHYGWIIKSQKPEVRSQKSESRKQKCIERLTDEVIDEVILTVMRSPKSYTKEDIVEINCHSGIVALRETLNIVLANGARLAEPGEFTKRAFLNGRIDLGQAEAVLDIINAKTNLSLSAGIRQLKGGLSAELARIRRKLLDMLVVLEADIDFPEEGPQAINRAKLDKALEDVYKRINDLLTTSNHGKILREGISAVIVGRPNVGKSSLLNALLKEERAIVTAFPGTTRDTIEEILDLQGIPLKIADTAGIIEPRDLIEKEAVKRSQKYFKQASLILLVFDSSLSLVRGDWQLIRKAKGRQVIAVLNKSDLKQRIEGSRLKGIFPHLVRISSLKRTGLKELEGKIVSLIWQGQIGLSSEVVLTNSRHIQCLGQAKEALERARLSFRNNLSVELIAEDIKSAKGYIGQITGEAVETGILNAIFAKFCIGK